MTRRSVKPAKSAADALPIVERRAAIDSNAIHVIHASPTGEPMITEAPDRRLSAARLAAEIDALRREVAAAPSWRYREKYVDRGRVQPPFYILDFRDAGDEAGDDLLDEPLFATRSAALRVKHVTRRREAGSEDYWQLIHAAALDAQLGRFFEMYRDGYLQPPGARTAPAGEPRPHPRFDGKRFVFRLRSPSRTIVGVGPAGVSGEGAVRGVVCKDGRPLGGAEVELCLDDGLSILRRSADAEGRFWFARVPAGNHRLHVRGHALTAEIKVEPFGCVRGRVLDPTAQPVVGARVELLAPDGEAFDATTDSVGAFSVGCAPAWALRVRVPGFMFTAAISFQVEGAVAITVVNQHGKPLAGIEVVLAREQVEVGRKATDAGGRAKFEGLIPGRHTVNVPGHRVCAAPQRTAEIRGTLRGPGGPHELVLMAGDEVAGTTRSDAGGSFAFPRVAPGSYSIRSAAGLMLRRKDRS